MWDFVAAVAAHYTQRRELESFHNRGGLYRFAAPMQRPTPDRQALQDMGLHDYYGALAALAGRQPVSPEELRRRADGLLAEAQQRAARGAQALKARQECNLLLRDLEDITSEHFDPLLAAKIRAQGINSTETK